MWAYRDGETRRDNLQIRTTRAQAGGRGRRIGRWGRVHTHPGKSFFDVGVNCPGVTDEGKRVGRGWRRPARVTADGAIADAVADLTRRLEEAQGNVDRIEEARGRRGR